MGGFVKLIKSNILLICIILLSLFLTIYPHLDYKYPLHVDEWIHVTVSEETMEKGMVPSYDPYLSWYRPHNNFEDGFHIFLASFFFVTGIDPVNISLVIPLLFTFLMVISVYMLAMQVTNNKSVALLAALIIGTRPSDVTFLGHIFAVPSNLGLVFIPLVLYSSEKSYYLPLTLLVGASFIIYPPVGLISVISVIMLYIMRCVHKKRLPSKNLAYLGLGILLGLPLIINILSSSQSIQLSPYFFMVNLLKYFSYSLAVLAIVGIGSKFRETDSALFAYIFSLVLLIIPFRFMKFGFFVPYERLILFFFPVLSIYSAVGILFFVEHLARFKRVFLILAFIAIGILGVVSNFGAYNYYYHIISDREYTFYTSFKETVPDDSIFLVRPDKAVAFVPLSGKKTVSWWSNSPEFNDVYKETDKYYRGRMNDTEKNIFFRKYNIKYAIHGLEVKDVR